ELGATVVEHPGDYTSTVSSARSSVAERDNTHFIDDENSWDLFVGYAGAGEELAEQLRQANVEVSIERPLVVYLPCGVGGAPGGITYGLKSIFGDAVVCVFVEPVNSACVFVALACDGALKSVYDVGLSNNTEADGLAVSRASELVLSKVGKQIDAVVAVPDESMLAWVGRAWSNAALRLEPSATAGFAALEPFLQAINADQTSNPARPALHNVAQGTHVVWTTGGDLMPEAIFRQFL
ncbi:MAG: D-serine ammonia-lyase, partial [Woeseia sp.]